LQNITAIFSFFTNFEDQQSYWKSRKPYRILLNSRNILCVFKTRRGTNKKHLEHAKIFITKHILVLSANKKTPKRLNRCA